MSKHRLKGIFYSNNPFFASKGGAGDLIIETDNLTFNVWLDTIRISKADACIRILNEEKFRVLNKEYKFIYVYSKALSDIVANLQAEKYHIVNEENIKVRVGLLQRDFGRMTMVVVFIAFFLFSIYVFLFRLGMV